MERLVYAPKVQAYVQTDTGIVDLTDFVVSGNVTRNINAVSTAEITIQNPNKRFTKPGNPTFRPMDLITIFLSRFREHPVQVFTGYLDQTPYLQLHPGTCTLTASCTLKRLQFTYWDPGIRFTQQFLNKHNWYTDTVGGTIYKVPDTPNDPNAEMEGNPPPKIDDGSIGNLIYLVLSEIGNWKNNTIRVEQMPKGIGKTIKEIFMGLRNDDEELEREVNRFLRDMVGEYAVGGPGGGGGNPIDIGGSGPKKESIVTPEEVGVAMLRAGFPANERVIASGIETVEGESSFGQACAADGWGVNFAGCCAGYWQIYLSVHNVSLECANTLDCATKTALSIWKNAGNCFACQDGPNPWQGGTDNGTKYMSVARRVIQEAKNSAANNAGNLSGR